MKVKDYILRQVIDNKKRGVFFLIDSIEEYNILVNIVNSFAEKDLLSNYPLVKLGTFNKTYFNIFAIDVRDKSMFFEAWSSPSHTRYSAIKDCQYIFEVAIIINQYYG